jgi:hypothetical protein
MREMKVRDHHNKRFAFAVAAKRWRAVRWGLYTSIECSCVTHSLKALGFNPWNLSVEKLVFQRFCFLQI